jgi:hypothetical protein
VCSIIAGAIAAWLCRRGVKSASRGRLIWGLGSVECLYRVELGLNFELQKSGVGKVGSCSTNVIVAVAEVPTPCPRTCQGS